MIRSVATYAFLLVMLAFPTDSVLSQTEFVERMDREFLTRKPLIGEFVEDVEFFDEDGNAMRLGSTRGKYTVLIFGCLT